MIQLVWVLLESVYELGLGQRQFEDQALTLRASFRNNPKQSVRSSCLKAFWALTNMTLQIRLQYLLSQLPYQRTLVQETTIFQSLKLNSKKMKFPERPIQDWIVRV